MYSPDDPEDDVQAIATVARKAFKSAHDDAFKKGRVLVYASDGILFREVPGQPPVVIGKTEPPVLKPAGWTAKLR